MNKDDIIIEEVTSSDIKEDYKLKVVVVGDSGVGKTNIIKRFISNKFIANSKATVGAEFTNKSYRINDRVFKIEIWDTAGRERYKSITAAYYKGAKGALVVYDTTQKESYDNIDGWMLEIKDKGSKDMKIMIIGNKIDLVNERKISTKEALEKAKIMNTPMMETSALNATNIKEAFFDLLKEMYEELRKKSELIENQAGRRKEGIFLETREKNKNKRCC